MLGWVMYLFLEGNLDCLTHYHQWVSVPWKVRALGGAGKGGPVWPHCWGCWGPSFWKRDKCVCVLCMALGSPRWGISAGEAEAEVLGWGEGLSQPGRGAVSMLASPPGVGPRLGA